MNDQELAKQLDEARRGLFNLRFRLATRQLVNHREVGRVRRDIARILTVQRERQLIQAEAAMAAKSD
ncbi:MAG: 50S ribosomal protein L29 [Chloroflexi bacterium]|nr:50S ribosomal protein L29 [Chloroflexota bacterium]